MAERHTFENTTILYDDHGDWPKWSPVICLDREREIGGETTLEVSYSFTSLSREKADAS